MAVLIDRPPEIMALTVDREKYLIEVPLIARPGTPTAQLIGVLLTKLAAPFTDGLISHHYTSLQPYFFHVTEAQAEPKVQPHGMGDDLNRTSVILMFRGGR